MGLISGRKGTDCYIPHHYWGLSEELFENYSEPIMSQKKKWCSINNYTRVINLTF